MKAITAGALPFTFLAAAIMLGGCVAEKREWSETDTEAEPASANNKACYGNAMDFALPDKPDIKVQIDTCVESSENRRRAYVKGSWSGRMDNIGGTRFDSFVITYRLEQNDDIKLVASHELTDELNKQYSGTFGPIQMGWFEVTSENGWSCDGVAEYNINADGPDTQTWELHGSPLIP
jgi:hypothetical protein